MRIADWKSEVGELPHQEEPWIHFHSNSWDPLVDQHVAVVV
jgi:hypothetical protein